MKELIVEKYSGLYDTEIAEHILAIQVNEFQIPVTLEDQPDILAIKDFYMKGKGNFLLALYDGEVVGTMGLLDIGGDIGVLRKVFVKKEFRGQPHNTAVRLLREMLNLSKKQGVGSWYLGTTALFLAAHKFYEKNGFTLITAEELPENFPRMKVDTVFYRLAIK